MVVEFEIQLILHACNYEYLYTSIYMDSDIENNAYTSVSKGSFNHRKQIDKILLFINLFFKLTLVHSIYRCESFMITS